jgi:hypothetical protein
MLPITPQDRAEWIEHAHARDMDQTQVRHRRTIAGRIVLAAALALFCAAVIGVSVAAVEIASDWLHSGRPM